MKDTDIHIGKCYDLKVGRNTTAVRITKPLPTGGWEAVSLSSNKTMTIKSGKRVVGPHNPKAGKQPDAQVSPDTGEPATPAGTPKRLSALDAAAKVLAEAREPMNCKELIKVMAEKDYWQPKNAGKTPQNTLHASISKEIKTKGADARFEKVARGFFDLRKR